MMLYWMQQTGHRPIALMGGGTTRVGDPSGKDESRKILTDEIINENLKSIRKTFDKFLKFGTGPNDAVMANNADWLNSLNYIDMLRDVGRHFSVNRMLSFDSVKLRLDRQQELSFLEFNYMILQAYDFVELHKRYGCILQMGGSDQWGNIINGIDLGRRMMNAQLFALTAPLITTSSGAKMGKTAAGAVWLNADLVSPYDYWQFWRNTEDGDVERFLKLFTILPLDEIERLGALQGRGAQRREEDARDRGDRADARPRRRRSGRRHRAPHLRGRHARGNACRPSRSSAPISTRASAFSPPVWKPVLSTSTSEARRQIKGGGLKVNDVDRDRREDAADGRRTSRPEGVIKLSLGSKKHVLAEAGLISSTRLRTLGGSAGTRSGAARPVAARSGIRRICAASPAPPPRSD